MLQISEGRLDITKVLKVQTPGLIRCVLKTLS